MKATLRRYCERYCLHHDMSPPLLQWIGTVGVIALALFYLLRATLATAAAYDDFALGAVAIAFSLLLAIRPWWPARLQRFYLPSSYAAALYCLSFLSGFTALRNQGATLFVVNMVMGSILIVLLADWRNAVVMLTTGYAASVVAFLVSDPGASIPPIFLAAAGAALLVVLAGALSQSCHKRAELDRIRRLYAGLAGSIAHEMRHPLSQLRHVLDTLEHSLASKPEGCAKDELQSTLHQGQDAVARGLQAIAITLQQLDPRAFDTASFQQMTAGQCARRAVREFAYESEEQRARVSVEVKQDFTFHGDETGLLLVLFNLMKNALYFLPTHPSLNVSIVVDGRGGDHRIEVRDSGPGIEAKRIPRLFHEFNSQGKSEGAGLGLAFCRRVMQAFGGGIACESRPGQSTCFTLRFPALAKQEGDFADEPLEPAELSLTGTHVLVVDDEPRMRMAARMKLHSLGCEITEAASGEQAMEKLRTTGYDLVLLDVNMPGMDGFLLTRCIRQGALPGRENIAIIGYSALPCEVGATRAQQSGMDVFLNKGCEALELGESIRRLLSSGTRSVPARARMTSLTGRTVLLADDNTFNRTIVRGHLIRMGADVIEAEHGAAVLQLLEAGLRPSALVMDLEMPGMGGAAACRAVRAMPAPLGRIPIVALTAHGSASRHAEARSSGMDVVLIKPVEPDVLRGTLTRLLGASEPARKPQVTLAPRPAASARALRKPARQKTGDGSSLPLPLEEDGD